jgi:hypothetical protein
MTAMAMYEKQINEILGNPEKALKLNDEQLDAVIQDAIGLYGATANPQLVEKLLLLYRHYAERIHPAQRFRNYQAAVDLVLGGKSGVHSLMPFICCDPARPVASTAALDYAVLAPTSEENAATGALELLDLYDRGALANGLAVLGGLVMTGDRRILTLLVAHCRSLSCEEVEILIKCRGSLLTHAVVDFYLEWLEALDCRDNCDIFAAVAAGFANLAIGSTDGVVYDIERVIPSTPDNAVRITNQWPLPEYAASIASRLQQLAEREEGEPIIPEVMSIWGLV